MLLGKKEKEENRIIREKITKTRLDRKETQEDLARRVGKSQKNLSDIERGRTEISAIDLMYIAVQLEKPIQYFVPYNHDDGLIISEEEWDLLRDYRRTWKEENRELARKLLREIADRETEQDINKQKKEYEARVPKKGKKPKGKK